MYYKEYSIQHFILIIQNDDVFIFNMKTFRGSFMHAFNCSPIALQAVEPKPAEHFNIAKCFYTHITYCSFIIYTVYIALIK